MQEERSCAATSPGAADVRRANAESWKGGYFGSLGIVRRRSVVAIGRRATTAAAVLSVAGTRVHRALFRPRFAARPNGDTRFACSCAHLFASLMGRATTIEYRPESAMSCRGVRGD